MAGFELTVIDSGVYIWLHRELYDWINNFAHNAFEASGVRISVESSKAELVECSGYYLSYILRLTYTYRGCPVLITRNFAGYPELRANIDLFRSVLSEASRTCCADVKELNREPFQ